MPGGNGTGPMGMGPMTGRAAGLCTGNNVNPNMGRGLGLGRGFGRGQGWCRTGLATPAGAVAPIVPVMPDQEVDLLKAQADNYKAALQSIEERIAGLESGQ